MSHIRLLEKIVDERILKTDQVFRSRFAKTQKHLDLAVWVRYV